MIEFRLKGQTPLHSELHQPEAIESLLAHLRDVNVQQEPFAWLTIPYHLTLLKYCAICDMMCPLLS